MAVIIPRETIEKFSKIESIEEYRDQVLNQIGDLSAIEVLLNRVLVAVYIENEYFWGGQKRSIAKTTDRSAESIWQGKPALVLKVGPLAFQDDSQQSFAGQSVKAGDWVTFKIGNSSQIEIRSIPCRIVQDVYIEAVYRDPRIVTS